METRAVASDKIANLYSEYIWVKLQATAGADHKEIEPKRGGMLIMFMPDGSRIGDFDLKKSDLDASIEAIQKAHETVNEKYPSKQTSWTAADAMGEATDKLVAFLFVDEKDASQRALKAFDDRWVNLKTMDKVTPVKVEDLKGELATKYKVVSAPTLILVNRAAAEAKQVLDRKTGELSARTLKKTLDRCVELMEKANK